MMTCILANLVTVGVFTGLAVFLFIAEKFLANYGTCVVTVNDGEHVLEEPGGATLLSILNDNGINIPSACGGKGTCGYCKVKVTAGGGPVLPTETPYLTRGERHGNVRLACQVKVKDDMAVSIPDFLTVIKGIIENRSYDPNRRWRFIVE